jgi:2-furoyl-CoA dehydrogenase large subunit
VLRSPFAHAQITRLDFAAALELPGVVGVLTGADVAELSRPFPAGIDSPIPHYAAAHETVRYVGEPVAVVVARDRYLAEDAAELIEVEYEPLDPVLDVETAVESDACVSDRSFSYGDVGAALERSEIVVSQRFRANRWSCTPVECYGVVADWKAHFSEFWPKGTTFYAPLAGIQPGEVALLRITAAGPVKLNSGVMVANGTSCVI